MERAFPPTGLDVVFRRYSVILPNASPLSDDSIFIVHLNTNQKRKARRM